MATQDFTRKLTAILTADVKGYSRLMGENEIETVRTITAYREVMSTLIHQHRGRVVDSPGDNVLSEFTSVVDAVQCAVEIQKDFQTRNAELPEERRMEFRIGINLGDVIQDGERIYGDGVNIAARVEGLAEGGGICITRNVYDQVKKKLTLGYEYIGEHAVKNITEPVRVYRVLLEPEDAGKVIGEKIAPPKQKRKLALAASVFVIVGVITVTSWNMYFRPLPIEVPPPEKLGTSLPDNPSIAVLPFTNMSDDPKQEYLSDGITEDIITDLSKIKNLLVIARNSTFVYKGKPVDIKLVGLELGVRYVLEGSLRKAGSRVRITAQLIDTSTGYHLWSDRYDGEGEMEDVFDLQDRITNKIVSELSIKLTRNEKQNIKRPETDNIEAYDAFMRGWAHFQIMTSEDYAKAVHYFRKAIKIDPNYNRAYAALSRTIFQGSAMYGTKWSINVGTRSSDDAILLSFELLELAKKKPNTLAFLHSAHVSAFKFRFNQAIYDAQKALEIEPNSASANLAMCMALIYFGRPDEVTVYLEKYKKLNPGKLANYYYYLGLARFQQRRLAEAETLIKRAIQFSKEGKLYHLLLSSISAHLGHQKQARIALKKFGQGDAFNWNLKTVQRFFLFYNNQQFLKRFAQGLLKAGLPGKLSDLQIIVKKNQLEHSEVENLFLGKIKLIGGGIGEKYMRKYTKDGKILDLGEYYKGPFSDAPNKISGRYWILDGKLCEKLDLAFVSTAGRVQCGFVYRNPNGSKQTLDTYLWMTYMKRTVSESPDETKSDMEDSFRKSKKMTTADGTAKNGKFIRTASPSFTLDYPVTFQMQLLRPSEIFWGKHVTTDGSWLNVNIVIEKVKQGLVLSEVIQGWLNNFDSFLKKVGNKPNVISNKPIKSYEGFIAREIIIDWKYQDVFPMTVIVHLIIKEDKIIALRGWDVEGKIKPALEVFKTINLHPEKE